MTKRIIALLLALILTVGLLPTVALAADAQPDVQVSKSDDNLNLVKTIKKAGENYTVTLESWATGAVTTETTPMPLDIILVLDESGSMSETFSSKQGTYYEKIKYYRTNQNYYKWSKENDGIWYKDIDNNYYKVTVQREKVEDFISWHYKFTYTYSKNGTAMTIGSSERKNTNPGYTFYRQYTGDVNITKRAALVEAATNFADSVYKEATKANGPDHRIAVVTYSGDAQIKTGTTVNDALISVTTGLNAIKSAINDLETEGGTYINKGIQKANNIFEKNPIAEEGKRARVMIVFTDGAPGRNGMWCKDSQYYDTHKIAQAAIKEANTAEQTYKATVYTIGIFQGANVGNPKSLPTYTTDVKVSSYDGEYRDDNEKAKATANSNRFMHLVSSNYPNAINMTNTGNYNVKLEEDDNNTYYLAAASASELSDVFTAISSSIKTDTTELNETATIIDNIPGNFTIPAEAREIKVYTAKCTGKTGETLSWKERQASNLQPTTTTNSTTGVKSVSVTGFDYSDEWCGLDENSAPHGSKLIIEFTISHNNYGGTQPTNAGASIKDEENRDVITVDNPSVPVTISKPDDIFASAIEKTYDGTGFDILDKVAKEAKRLANGTNNKFVDIEVKVTVGNTDYIYTIPAGQTTGTWNQTGTPKTSPDVKATTPGTAENYVYPVTITFKDAAEGSTASNSTEISAKFKINYKDVTVKANNKTKKTTEADPTTFDATVTGMINGEKAEDKLNYTISRTDAQDNTVGDHKTITPSGDTYQNNYKVTYETGTLTITQGDPTATELSLTGKFQKTLNSNTANVPRKSFELTITGTSDNTDKTAISGTADIGTLTKQGDKYTGSAYFGFSSALKFSTDGTYKYKVQETKGNVAGMSYDTTAYELVIEVENKNGALEIKSATIGETDMKNAGPFTITNTFTAAELPLDPTTDPTTGEVTPKIVKKLRVTSGSAAPTADLPFTVAVYEGNAVDEAKRVATGTATIPANSPDETTVNFTGLATLVFPEAGRFTYTIHEDTGSTSGVRYDGYLYTMTVEVTKNTSDNSLSATCSFSYPLGEETVVANSITITNTYTEPKEPRVVSKKVVTTDAQFPGGLDTAINEFKSKCKIEKVLYPTGDGTTNNMLEVPYGTDSVTLLYAITVNRGTESNTMDFDDNGATFVFAVDADVAPGSHDHFEVTFNDGISTAVIYVAKTHTPLNFVGGKCTVKNVISEEIKATTTVTEKDPDKLYLDFSKFVQKELTATGTKTASDVNFTVDVKEFKTVISSIQGEEEVNTYAGEQLLSTTLTAHFDSITGGETKTAPFNGSIVVEHAGTYSFELTEEDGQRTGVTYDDSTYKVYVYVKREGDKLVVGSFNIYKDGWSVAGETITFHNTIDTGKDDYYPIIIPTIINKDTGMLNKTDHFAYVIGYPDGTVHPNGQITRAEVATIFFRLLRDEVRDGAFTTSNSYSDVAYGKWYNNPISTMSALGIITGYPDGTFKPNKPITRAEFAAIAARFDETQSGKSATFSDVIGHWAAKEIGIAYYNDWIKGYPDGTFKPDQNITRAEAMTLINRVLERKPESPADLLTNMNKWTDNMDTSKWYYLDVQEATNSHGYTRKTFNYELWRQMLPDPDWSRYER